MIGHIYIIRNNVNHKIYVGKTVKGYLFRFQRHKQSMSFCNQAIYRAMRKYGVENFYVELLKEIDDCTHKLLNTWELIFVKKFQANNPKFGYNMTPGGEGNPMTSETAVKITNTIRLPENRKKMSNIIKQKYIDNPDYKAIVVSYLPKAREAGLNRDHTHTEETKEKIRNSRLNSEKAKSGNKSMRIKVTAHHRTPEFREKCRQRMLNKVADGTFISPNTNNHE